MKYTINWTCMMLVFFCVASITYAKDQAKELEAKHLSLYASFDRNADADCSRGRASATSKKNIELVQGKFGSAARFSGDSKQICELVYAAKDNINPDEWTLCAWFKLDHSGNHYGGGKGPIRSLFRLYSDGGWAKGDIFAGFDRWGHLFFNAFNARKECRYSHASGGAVPKGKWTHLAFTWKKGVRKIFCNGFEIKCATNTPVKMIGETPTRIRIGNLGKPPGFGGEIDELKIFDKALGTDDVKAVMASLPRIIPAEPIFEAYLDGKVDGVNLGKAADSSTKRLSFATGVIGKGALMIRHGYDSRSTLSFRLVKGLATDEMTLSFFFIPMWNGHDGALHGLMAMTNKNGGWSLRKDKSGKLVFEISEGKKKWRIEKDVKGWKKNVPYHIVAGYSLVEKKMMLAVNGLEVVSGEFGADLFTADGGLLIVGDVPGTDNYSVSQAEGVIDEIRIFDRLLAPAEWKKEAGRNKENVRKRQVGKRKKAHVAKLAVKQQEKALWDLKGAFQEKTDTRNKISLNALWRFQLTNRGESPLAKDWCYLAVPGRYSGYTNGRCDGEFFIRDKNLKRIKPRGNQYIQWKGKPTLQYRDGWFERAFSAQPHWKDRRVTLCLDQLGVSQTADVYLNGKLLASLGKEKFFEIEIDPKKLRYDSDNFLLIHTVDHGNCYAWRGIKGDTWLSIRPKVYMEKEQVITSVREKRFTLNVDVTNRSDMPQTLRVQCQIHGDNAPAKPLESSFVTIGPGESKRLTASAPWKNPRFWDFQNPYLYHYSLTLASKDGKVIDKYPKKRFGFREFWIDGGDYVLNGNRVHLRNEHLWMNTTIDYQWCLRYVRLLKELGYNSLRYSWTADKQCYSKNVLRACDEEGLLVFVFAGGLNRGDFAKWNDPQTRKHVETMTRATVEPWRNHPSIVMWYLSHNIAGYPWDQHPLKMAEGWKSAKKKDFVKVLMEGAKILQKYDSSRPWFFQAGGAHGPVHTSNSYLCWVPLAERMEWAEEWSKRKPKPLHNIEVGFPYYLALFGIDTVYDQLKPYFLVENAARYFGQNAYRQFDERRRDLIDDPKTLKGSKGRSWKHDGWRQLYAMRKDPLALRLQGHMLVSIIQSWRGAGISGVCPFDELQKAFLRKSKSKQMFATYREQHNPSEFRTPGWKPDILKYGMQQDIDPDRPTAYCESIKAAFSPLLVYIGGESQRPTAMDHTWFSGAKINKSIVIVNDHLQSETFKLKWEAVSSSGAVVAENAEKVQVKAGHIVRLPVKFTAPEVSEASGFELRVTVSSPKAVKVKPFAFRVYPNFAPKLPRYKIALYDTKGLTAAALRTRGVEFTKLSEIKSLQGCRLVVIGRESLNGKFHLQAKRLGLTESVRKGMVDVLVFEQTDLSAMGLDVHPVYSRIVFPAGQKSPLLEGIAPENLSWWSGDGTLVEAYPPPDPTTRIVLKDKQFWHWGNRNIVTTFPIRRPCAGSYRLHTATGKDLIYTPLLEMRPEMGRIIFCQMEITDRIGKDPAATAILDNLIRYCAAPRKLQRRELAYLGGDKGKNFLHRSGFKAKPVKDISSLGGKDILVVDIHGSELKKLKQQLYSKAKAGATVVFMPLDKNDIQDMVGAQTETLKIGRYETLKNAKPLLAALDDRDRFFRYAFEALCLKGDNVTPLTAPTIVAERKIGSGRFVFVQADPFVFDKKMEEEKAVGFDTSNLWAYGIEKERVFHLWSTLLAGLGAASIDDMACRLTRPATEYKQDLCGQWRFSTDPNNVGVKEKWYTADFDDSRWKTLKVPLFWEQQGIKEVNPSSPSVETAYPGSDYDGVAWYRKKIKLAPELRNKDLVLLVSGGIDDFDWTYLNGKEIGRTGEETPGYWSSPRRYSIPAEMIAKDGEITISIRVFDKHGMGGFGPGKVELREKTLGRTAHPYYQYPLPSYNTESFNRY